ncbi:MAG: M56 family metallopeptidase [Gemmatimonadales bacterium]
MNDAMIAVLGLGLIHSLWQGAFVVTLTGAFLAVAGNRPRVRYVILSLALAALVVWPVVTVAIAASGSASAGVAAGPPGTERLAEATRPAAGAPGPGRVDGTPNAVRIGAADRWGPVDWVARWSPHWVDRALPVLGIGWILGVGLGLLRIAGAWVVLRRMIARAVPAPTAVAERAAAMASRLGLTRAVRIMASADVLVPCAAGLLRPVVLLPAAMLSGLSPGQVDLILTHELAHIRRWDYLVNFLQTMAETLLFYHPAAWWLSRRIRIEREYCCDDLVVGAVRDPVGYARALTDLESSRAAAPRLASGWRDGSLGDRVERLVGRAAPRPALGWLPVAVALLCLAAVARVGAVPVPRPLPEAGPDTLMERVSVSSPVTDSVPPLTADPAVALGEVIRHPDPAVPLAERWAWALAEARRRAWGDITIGWGIRAATADGDLVASGTRGGSWQDRGRPVATLLGEPLDPGVVFFVSVDGLDPTVIRKQSAANGLVPGVVGAVAIRSMDGRYSPRGANIVWLGRAPDRASVGLLERLIAVAEPAMRSELGAAVTLHDDVGLVVAAAGRIARDDESDQVRGEVLSWLPRHLPDAAVRALLVGGLTDRSPKVRDEALSALANGPDREALLVDAIAKSPYPDVRSEAIQALDRGDGSDTGSLVGVLRKAAFDDSDGDVQREAVDALIELDRAAADRVLREVADRHPNRSLRREAAEALAERRGER